MRLFSGVLFLLLFVGVTFDITHATTSPELVYQYDTPTWIENFVVRDDGHILPARATSAILTQLDLCEGTQETVTNKSSVGNAIMGITEVVPDLFAMSTMYCDLSKLACTPGTGITWSVDLRGTANVHDAHVMKLVEGPSKKSLLNGMAGLNKRKVLMVDQALGGIWAVDMVKGGATMVIQDEAMQDPQDQGNGVNGIRVRKNTLYFNNPSRGTFCRVPINMETGAAVGQVHTIAKGLELDDFEVDEDRGLVYVTGGSDNTLLKLDLATGHHSVYARDLPGPTSARWTNGGVGGCSLYVSTTGGYPQWLNGNATTGGAIYRIET